MNPYYSDDKVTLYHGDCLDVLPTLPDCSVDAVVTLITTAFYLIAEGEWPWK